MGRVDRCGFVDHFCFQINALETSIEVRLSEFLWENKKRHQPIEGIDLHAIVVVFQFRGKRG